jgi:hypothetical protein
MQTLASRKREISPAVNCTVEEYMCVVPSPIKEIILAIRDQRTAGTRPLPSAKLVDASSLLTPSQRAALLDSVAILVDENLSGRSEMCLQFADLLQRSLAHLKFPARAAVGSATYYAPDGKELFSWQHAWVRVGDEVIDGNSDCLFENPMVPKEVTAAPYWGNIKNVPGRRLRQDRAQSLPPDTDVSDIWWPS